MNKISLKIGLVQMGHIIMS